MTEDSRSIALYLTDGHETTVSVDISNPDNDGDIRLEVFKGARSTAVIYSSPSGIRALARALLEAAQ